ncbi:diphthine--ammonia ligase [Sitophilus oryzae]|uniref:Diphthine--ammonia ligase n=1 Tax=Sitophilus oryzae TaxID=7048 RepID=A0A6J2YY49_SITOR|nr:diphthine--ammonia ligase [Sitophilus oryzae]XP_030768164.1 diphthine--ammonia ligase [Sitophilus oryzae]XP_030768165.1 diphthine--ammonia ligase [Sitophilus oryzae]
MRVVALVSGGKDSTFNMMQCVAAGHKIVALANLFPYNQSEIDSFMYQSVGHEAVDLIAQAIDLPIYKKCTYGVSKKKGKNYDPCDPSDEVEDLYNLLKEIQNEIEFDGVSVGAILSNYQRIRVENVCIRLNLTPLAYLWQRNQEDLLDDIIKCEVDAIVIKVAALGLEPKKHLGHSLSQLQPYLLSMHEKYGINVCGEGGEYESLTLDCPLFMSRLVVEDSEIVMHQDDPIAPVGYLKFNKISLEFKLPALDLQSRLQGLPLKDSYGYILEDGEEILELSNEEDETENSFLLASEIPQINIKPCLIQQPHYGKSKDGWLWIGGIQGLASNPEEALEEAIDKIKCILHSNAHDVKDVCSVIMYIRDMSEYSQLNATYIKAFNHTNPPTRACVQVPIGHPVQLEVISWKKLTGELAGDGEIDRQTMHVQSISHWAPCNIGPYSQAVKIGDFIHLAGQIALVPGNMQLVSQGIISQCKVVVRHIGRLLTAVDNTVNLRDVVQGICYLTHHNYIDLARRYWESKTNNAIVEYVVVTGLPRSAAIEWQVWAHKHNNQFEYEERGKCIDNYSISLYRRINYDNNVAAIVCRVENIEESQSFDSKIFLEAVSYSIDKLKQGTDHDPNTVYNLKIFYSVFKLNNPEDLLEIMHDFIDGTNVLVYNFIPVIELKNKNTILSICGVRNQ